jgi:hypothetical protein
MLIFTIFKRPVQHGTMSNMGPVSPILFEISYKLERIELVF